MLPKKLPDGTFLWPHNVDVLKKAKQIPLTGGGRSAHFKQWTTMSAGGSYMGVCAIVVCFPVFRIFNLFGLSSL